MLIDCWINKHHKFTFNKIKSKEKAVSLIRKKIREIPRIAVIIWNKQWMKCCSDNKQGLEAFFSRFILKEEVPEYILIFPCPCKDTLNFLFFLLSVISQHRLVYLVFSVIKLISYLTFVHLQVLGVFIIPHLQTVTWSLGRLLLR